MPIVRIFKADKPEEKVEFAVGEQNSLVVEVLGRQVSEADIRKGQSLTGVMVQGYHDRIERTLETFPEAGVIAKQYKVLPHMMLNSKYRGRRPRKARYAFAYVLRKKYGLTHSEIADLIGISSGQAVRYALIKFHKAVHSQPEETGWILDLLGDETVGFDLDTG